MDYKQVIQPVNIVSAVHFVFERMY